jgi:hypothetical protein
MAVKSNQPLFFRSAATEFGKARSRRTFFRTGAKVIGASVLATTGLDLAKASTALGEPGDSCFYCSQVQCPGSCCNSSSNACQGSCPGTGFTYISCIPTQFGQLRFKCTVCWTCDCIKYLSPCSGCG